ncbi:shikimate kinase [Geothermobacter ehrlichii]|uniref:Shikimate kinase n=1 Tax=Geothermobacter ehrlichii TaxID=213224 RepID=A0A5D3WN15_9BACT|nr:shikimate kinase [Geothermobacter ehrlichii]TYO99961.1 shikimate kinase [Geothermobacter ehrlichii]
MAETMNIVLVGFMASGKSTVGKALADRLGWQFVDCDELVVGKAGRSIPEIFAGDGEEVFRDLETAVLDELQGRQGTVIATGGGIVTREANWELMRRLGPVVFLRTAPEILRQRLLAASGRPLADGMDWEAILLRYRQRLPAYERADVTVDIEDEPPAMIVERICTLLAGEVDRERDD